MSELAKSFDPPPSRRNGVRCGSASDAYAPTLDASRPSFCIQLPPPNVTGTLHMGHAFNQTIMDALTRMHRMRGFNTLWVPGTDHAGIATQIVVERQLQDAGLSRHDLGRKNFVAQVWDWKASSGATITTQMRRIGDSVSLGARVLHDGREAVGGRHRNLRAALRRGPDLSRQAPGELGPGAEVGGIGPRGRERGRGRLPLAHPLPDGGRQRLCRRRDDAPRDDARRHRGDGSPGRRAIRRDGRQAGSAAADGTDDSGHRRRHVDREFGTGA